MIWLNADGIESAYTWKKENILVNLVFKGSQATDAEFTDDALYKKSLRA